MLECLCAQACTRLALRPRASRWHGSQRTARKARKGLNPRSASDRIETHFAALTDHGALPNLARVRNSWQKGGLQYRAAAQVVADRELKCP